MPPAWDERHCGGRTGLVQDVRHMIKVGRDFDESAFARVVALLERA
jgi:hypothetical protein